MRTAEDNTLIPHVRMGVEAREQVVTKKGSLVKKNWRSDGRTDGGFSVL